MRRYLTGVLLAVGLLAGDLWAQDDAPPAPTPRDTVRKADGKILASVLVISETPTEVTLDTNGDGKADQTLDQNDVRAIQYGGAPASYARALAFYKVRQYDKATEMLREATKTPGVRGWVKDYAAYYLAMCLARESETAPARRPQAVEALEELLKNKENRWRDDARYELGQLQLAAGEKARALAVFQELERSAHRSEMKLTASVGLGAILMADGKPAEAVGRYDRVVSAAKGRFDDLYVTATVGKAEALTALKRFDEAETFIKSVLETAAADPLLAKAHLALGDCYYAQAEAAEDQGDARQKYKAALKQYLWNIVVFYNQKTEKAKSLLYAGRCWTKLGRPDRAQDLYGKLRKEFGSTKWVGMIGG